MISPIDANTARTEPVAAQTVQSTPRTEETLPADTAEKPAQPPAGITMQHHTDRVEISAQAQAQVQPQAQAQSTQTTDVSELVTETANSQTNLTSLSEQQLSDLVSKGTITQQQADAELARRSGAQQAQQAQQTAPQTQRDAAERGTVIAEE